MFKKILRHKVPGKSGDCFEEPLAVSDAPFDLECFLEIPLSSERLEQRLTSCPDSGNVVLFLSPRSPPACSQHPSGRVRFPPRRCFSLTLPVQPGR